MTEYDPALKSFQQRRPTVSGSGADSAGIAELSCLATIRAPRLPSGTLRVIPMEADKLRRQPIAFGWPANLSFLVSIGEEQLFVPLSEIDMKLANRNDPRAGADLRDLVADRTEEVVSTLIGSEGWVARRRRVHTYLLQSRHPRGEIASGNIVRPITALRICRLMVLIETVAEDDSRHRVRGSPTQMARWLCYATIWTLGEAAETPAPLTRPRLAIASSLAGWNVGQVSPRVRRNHPFIRPLHRLTPPRRPNRKVEVVSNIPFAEQILAE
jgi:hypothetical protein